MGGGGIFLEQLHGEKAHLVEKQLQCSLPVHHLSKFLQFQSPPTSVYNGEDSSHTPGFRCFYNQSNPKDAKGPKQLSFWEESVWSLRLLFPSVLHSPSRLTPLPLHTELQGVMGLEPRAPNVLSLSPPLSYTSSPGFCSVLSV